MSIKTFRNVILNGVINMMFFCVFFYVKNVWLCFLCKDTLNTNLPTRKLFKGIFKIVHYFLVRITTSNIFPEIPIYGIN